MLIAHAVYCLSQLLELSKNDTCKIWEEKYHEINQQKYIHTRGKYLTDGHRYNQQKETNSDRDLIGREPVK